MYIYWHMFRTIKKRNIYNTKSQTHSQALNCGLTQQYKHTAIYSNTKHHTCIVQSFALTLGRFGYRAGKHGHDAVRGVTIRSDEGGGCHR